MGGDQGKGGTKGAQDPPVSMPYGYNAGHGPEGGPLGYGAAGGSDQNAAEGGYGWSYVQPAYEAPVYEPPVYQPPVYQPSVYGQSAAYEQPAVYGQSAVYGQPPAYGQQAPGHQDLQEWDAYNSDPQKPAAAFAAPAQNGYQSSLKQEKTAFGSPADKGQKGALSPHQQNEFVTVDIGADSATQPDYPAADPGAANTNINAAGTRNAFLKKVYAIVFLQLAFTTGIAMLCIFVDPLRIFLVRYWLVWIVFFVATIVSLFVLQCVRHKHPINLIMLGVFTMFFSFAIGSICAAYVERGYGYAVAWAFVTTTAIFFIITVYCWVTRKDFSFLGGFIMGGFVALTISFLVVFVIDFATDVSRWVYFGINLGGSLLFTALLLYDSSQIVTRYPVDEYIQGAISLYVDVLNLYLCILGTAGAAT